MVKQIIRYFLIGVLLAVTPGIAGAQFYLTGDDPAKVKWNQIEGKYYKVIYPREIDSLAQRYLWLLEGNRKSVLAGLAVEPKPIPVILHPYTTISNGMVVWAPKRMELYTRPPAMGGYAQNWEKQLVLHETRHVGQISHFTKGVYKPLGWLFGQQITGLGVGVYPSKWFMEGGAVVAETELSNSGRGRDASFMEYYRASFLSGEYRSWDRWRYGSTKYYTPDIYAFGYLINTTVREKTGDYTYAGKLLDYYVKRFYNPNVIDAAYKKVVGCNNKKLLDIGMELYTARWKEDFESRGEYTRPLSLAHKESEYYTGYRSPLSVNADTTFYIKYGYESPAALVMLGSNPAFIEKHKRGEAVVRPFSTSASNLKLNGRKVIWTETVGDARWGKRSFTDLFSYSLDTKKITRVTRGEAYNNPAVSITGDTVSVVEYPVKGGSNLVLLQAETGQRLAVFPAPENGQLTESVWGSGDFVYALAITSKGLGLFALNVKVAGQSGGTDWKCVINEQPKKMSSLRAAGDELYFESDVDGVNNIYAFHVGTGRLTRLTNAAFAAHDPYIAGEKLYYTNLELNGRMPVYKEVEKVLSGRNVFLKDGTVQNEYKFPVAEMLSRQADDYLRANNIQRDTLEDMPPEVKYNVRPYKKGSHLFRFHSWAPVYYNVDKIMSMSADHFYELVSLGATAYSQNSLGTAVTMLGYSYRNGYHAGHLSFEYSGWYPVFKIMADYNAEDRYEYKINKTGGSPSLVKRITGDPLLKLSIQAYVPVKFNSRGWQRGLVPQALWEYENNSFYSYNTDNYINRQQITYGLQYYQMRPVAEAAIFPKWGFNVTVKGAFSPNGEENFGSVLSGYTYFYLPGFMRRQGLRVSASYQKQFVENKWMFLDNLAGMPRGYDDYYGKDYYKVSLDYAIPVHLEDASLGWLFYFKRLQIIPFVDIAGIKNTNGITRLNSYGGDLLLDAIVLHIGVPLSFGVRYARIDDMNKKNYFGFLFSMSLF